MKKLSYILFGILALSACNLDKVPSDAVSSSQMSQADNAEVATNGNYALFKAELPFQAEYAYSGDSYIRHFFEMAEFKSDDILLSASTTDVLVHAVRYEDTSTDNNLSYFWWVSYKALYGVNSLLEGLTEGTSTALDQIIGENYFLRAVLHFNLCRIFCYPYSHGKDNPGVVIRTSTDCSTTTRATIGEVYDQVEQDLKKAAELLKGKTARGNNGYATYEAAMGMLSRLYLYEEKNQECVDIVNEMLSGADPASKLDSDYEHLFQYSKTSTEVLWCIGTVASTVDFSDFKGAMGSMFYSPGGAPGADGWGEIYYSQPLLDLFWRHPEDLRYTTMAEPYGEDQSRVMIYWPYDDGINDHWPNYIAENAKYDSSTGKYSIVADDKKTYTVETETVNGFDKHYITKNGAKQYVSMSYHCSNRGTYPVIYMKKFANMDGESNCLNSPIMIRWAEVILNRAEAYAKLGSDDDALTDVNVIRSRAGLSGDALFTTGNYKEQGYSTILDVVLDERRLELCFEGFRAWDLFRNKKDMDRRYGGYQPYEVVKYSDSRIPFPIPYDETSVSGIEQNAR